MYLIRSLLTLFIWPKGKPLPPKFNKRFGRNLIWQNKRDGRGRQTGLGPVLMQRSRLKQFQFVFNLNLSQRILKVYQFCFDLYKNPRMIHPSVWLDEFQNTAGHHAMQAFGTSKDLSFRSNPWVGNSVGTCRDPSWLSKHFPDVSVPPKTMGKISNQDWVSPLFPFFLEFSCLCHVSAIERKNAGPPWIYSYFFTAAAPSPSTAVSTDRRARKSVQAGEIFSSCQLPIPGITKCT